MKSRFAFVLRALGLAITLSVTGPRLQGCSKSSDPSGEHEGHDHSKGSHDHDHGETSHKHVDGDEKK